MPKDIPDFSRKVLHYTSMELRNASILKFRKLVIRRKTVDRSTSAVAMA